MIPKIITVSQLNFYIKSIFENDDNLKTVLVEGEISNLKDHYASGHIYFSLKDQRSVVSAVMFSSFAKRLRFHPQSGMKVIVRARVSLYEPTGQYQLYVEDMQPDGVGALTIQLEQLKAKLEKEGLFSASHKKPIPRFPTAVGIITSPTGAAVQDIINILTRRYPYAKMVLYPVLVQGESAPEGLIRAINTFSQSKCADVVIIGRGGGSIEDLWAFNDEGLARAIYSCEVPVISAVGHETDFTICDFVSDLRAPTPSAAAELAVPDQKELRDSLSGTRQYLSSLMDAKFRRKGEALSRYMKLTDAYSPTQKARYRLSKLDDIAARMKLLEHKNIELARKHYIELLSKAEALNPLSTLKRGYAYVEKDHRVLLSSEDVGIGDMISVTLSDGGIEAQVLKKG